MRHSRSGALIRPCKTGCSRHSSHEQSTHDLRISVSLNFNVRHSQVRGGKMVNCIGGTKFQSITMKLAVLLFCVCIYVVWGADNIRCFVEPVEEHKNTTLECTFPENLNVSKKDFTIYHYTSHGSSESVVDCWWIKGSLGCYTKPGFEYNKKVNKTLTVTIQNVTSSHLGNYACQVSGYGADLLTFCSLQISKGKENTCTVVKKESQSSASLTCQFSEDIGETQRNFTVIRHKGKNMREEVITCWWEDGHNHCKFADGYINISRVSSKYTVLISNVTAEKEGSYSCWHSGSDTYQKTCLLYLPDEEADEEQSSDILLVVLISTLLGVAVVVVVAVVLFLIYRRKCLCSSKKHTESGDQEQSTPMLKTPLMEKDEEERKKVTDDFQEYLETSVKDMYPDITGTFYFVPPVYFNKTRYRKKHVTGEVTWVPDTPADNDVRHDQAMQHVIHCLRHLAEHKQEKMFVLTQLTFDAYLNNVGTEYDRHRLPTADSNNSNSVDLFIIHQKHGVLVGVVKAVSDDDVRGQGNQQKSDEMIILQVKEGFQQLDEAVCTMNNLTSDQISVEVRKVLMLPRLSRSSLKRAVDNQPDQFENSPDTEMFLCTDDLSDSNAPWHISSDQLGKLAQWWDKVMKMSVDHDLSEELYLRLIARFCGPPTQPSLQIQDDEFLLPKTLAEAVSVTGDLYNRPTLSQDMMELLREKRVFLVGPPNTGKTRLLTLVGKKWITSGHELHVFCGSDSSCTSLTHAFHEELRPPSVINDNDKYAPRKVNVQRLNFDKEKEIDEAVKNVIQQKREQNVYVIADEADVDGKYFRKFCECLKSRCPDVHLWATSSKIKTTVDGWQVKILTRPLHCPPAVVRECSPLEARYSLPEVTNKQLDNFYPTDGPPVKYIYHKKDDIISSHDCKRCGRDVGIFLAKHLITRNDKTVAEDNDLLGPSTTSQPRITVHKKFSVLQDKDLLVLFESGMEQLEKFVEGLRESGIAVDTVRAKDDVDVIVEETGNACAMHFNQLYKYRLRRKIVVYVESSSGPSDLSLKWRAMTSCTSQLIVVRKYYFGIPFLPTLLS